MDIDYEALLYQIQMLLNSGYIISIPLLLLLYKVHKPLRSLWRNLIFTCNLVLLVTAVLTGIKFVFDTSAFSLDDGTPNLYRWRVMGPYWYTYWAIFLGQLILPHVFWVKRWRWNKWMLLLVWLGIATESLFSRLFLYLISSYSDYLPSRWVYYEPVFSEIFVTELMYGAVIGVVYYLFKLLNNNTKPLDEKN